MHSARLLTDSFVTDAPDSDDYFPDDDFFPDVHDLLDDMAGEDTDPKSSTSTMLSRTCSFSFC